MPVPTMEHTNLVNVCINGAVKLEKTFTELLTLATYLRLNADILKSVTEADFKDSTTQGPLQGFDPSQITAFDAAVQSIMANVTANDDAIGKAVAALARRKPVQ